MGGYFVQRSRVGACCDARLWYDFITTTEAKQLRIRAVRIMKAYQ
jgi:hypothetical protein